MSEDKEFENLVIGNRKCSCGKRYDYMCIDSKCEKCCQDAVCQKHTPKKVVTEIFESVQLKSEEKEHDDNINLICNKCKKETENGFNCEKCQKYFCLECDESHDVAHVKCDNISCHYCLEYTMTRIFDKTIPCITYCAKCYKHDEKMLCVMRHYVCAVCSVPLLSFDDTQKKSYVECFKCDAKVCDDCQNHDSKQYMFEYEAKDCCYKCHFICNLFKVDS